MQIHLTDFQRTRQLLLMFGGEPGGVSMSWIHGQSESTTNLSICSRLTFFSTTTGRPSLGQPSRGITVQIPYVSILCISSRLESTTDRNTGQRCSRSGHSKVPATFAQCSVLSHCHSDPRCTICIATPTL